jgi:adenosylhomocysteine nucleosidase
MAGLAGALDPTLRAGDVIIDEQSTWLDPSWSYRRGGIHTATKIIATPAEKASLFHQTGAAVVDMENEKARQLAAKWNVPYLGIRAVADCADEALDPALLRMTDNDGRVQTGRVISALLRQPTLLARLWHVRACANLGLHRLGDVVGTIVRGTGFQPVLPLTENTG